MDYSNVFPGANGKPAGGGGIGNFDGTSPAPEFSPLPPGVYAARVVRGEYTTTKAGADAYRMRFEVSEGEHTGRTVVRTWTFGEKALPYTRRDLMPFGLTSTAQLLAPFPEPGREYRVRLVVALQRGDDGIERNDIKRIEVTGVTASPAAGFELPDDDGQGEGGRP